MDGLISAFRFGAGKIAKGGGGGEREEGRLIINSNVYC